MNNQYLLARISGYNSNLRASDADRERTAELLRTSHTDGRLDLAEFQQRLDRCYEAKTFGELDQLVSDLPRPDEPYQRRSSSLGRRLALPPLAAFLIAVLVISAAFGHGFFWLWIPLLFVVWRMSWFRTRPVGGPMYRGRWR